MMEQSVVHVVDDDPECCRALVRLLNLSGYSARCHTSSTEFLKMAGNDLMGCVILDAAMPRYDGLALQQHLSAHNSPLPIIFLSGSADIRTSVRALRAGAEDFLCKPVSKADLIAAVARALRRNEQQVAAQNRRADLNARWTSLTPREKEVFLLAVNGLKNKQIAYELGITERTIKAHRGQIMRKLSARTLVDLVSIANSLNLARGG
jgi:RNA polymerase sigma factor (sigma-70 family)